MTRLHVKHETEHAIHNGIVGTLFAMYPPGHVRMQVEATPLFKI